MKYSITKRLFTGVFVLILPLLLLQGIIFGWSRQTVTEEIRSTATANLEYLRAYLDQRIQNIYEGANIIATETNVGQFYAKLAHSTFESVSEFYMDLRDIRTTLGIHKYANELVQEVTLIFPQHNLMMKTAGVSVADAELLEKIYSAAQTQPAQLMEADGTLYSVYFWMRTADLRATPALLCMEINPDALTELLNSYSEKDVKSSYLFNSANHYLVSSDGAAPVEAQELAPLLSHLDSAGVRQQTLRAGGVSYEAFVCPSSYLDFAIIQLIPSALYNQIPTMIGGLLLLLCAATVVVLVNLLRVLRRTVGRPVDGLQHAFASAGQGDFSVRLPHQDAQEFDQLAVDFNAMAHRIDSLINTNYRQTIRLQTAELKRLQAQINPHFLYNSFYFLRHLVAVGDDETAEEFCRYLGQYFQYITRNDKNTLTLSEEYGHAVSYLNIQLMRFGDTVEAEIAPLPESMAQLETPRLIVEPVVENCFKHGLNTTESTSRIRISFEEDADTVSILLENNGNDLTDEALEQLRSILDVPAEEASFTGLVNTHHRLRIFYGGKAGVEVSRSALGGLLVRLRLTRTPMHLADKEVPV